MLYYRPINDIHREWDRAFLKKFIRKNSELYRIYEPSILPTDKDTILGIAGDIDTKKETVKFLKKMSGRFKAVVAVLGNHDYWRRDFSTHAAQIKEELKQEGFLNVHLLDCDSVVIDGYRFIGATLWTDFNKGDALLLDQSAGMMNDYRFMRKDGYESKVRPVDLLIDHRKAAKFIFDFAKNEEQMIVLSHHAPCFKSIDYDRYGMGPINNLYATEFGNEIAYSNFLIWHHGHIHTSQWYKIYETLVVCNPRGYFGHSMNDHFNDQLLIELK